MNVEELAAVVDELIETMHLQARELEKVNIRLTGLGALRRLDLRPRMTG
jgi:hypothetical protein